LAGRWDKRSAAGYWIPDQVRDDGWGGVLRGITAAGVIPGEDPGASMLGVEVGMSGAGGCG